MAERKDEIQKRYRQGLLFKPQKTMLGKNIYLLPAQQRKDSKAEKRMVFEEENSLTG